MHAHRTKPLVIASLLLLVLLVLSGVRPYDRATWAMEVFPVAIAVPLLWATYKRFPLTFEATTSRAARCLRSSSFASFWR
jgi:putative membrane protein